MADLHVFYDGDTTWLVGRDVADAIDAYEKLHLGGPMDVDDREGWTQLPDDQPLPIIDDVERPRAEWTRTTKPCGEWAAETGRGFLCSTEW